jgi:hypothetical protein
MGLVPCWVGPKPTSLEPQRGLGSEENMAKPQKKIQKFLDRGYGSERAVKALINYFVIPKGEHIQPVFDSTKSGLNALLWAPWFHLPTVDSHLRILDISY